MKINPHPSRTHRYSATTRAMLAIAFLALWLGVGLRWYRLIVVERFGEEASLSENSSVDQVADMLAVAALPVLCVVTIDVSRWFLQRRGSRR